MMPKMLVLAMVLVAEAAAVAATPSGKYHGVKTVLGANIDIKVNVDSSSMCDVIISGPLSVDCSNEKYTYDGKTVIAIPTNNTAGDCLHDTLAKAPGGGELTSLVYDPATDQITINAKIAFLSVSVILSTSGTAVQVTDDKGGWFKDFVHHFSKSYTAIEQPARLQKFKANLAKIEIMNKVGTEGHHWPNQHSDLSANEFQALQFKA